MPVTRRVTHAGIATAVKFDLRAPAGALDQDWDADRAVPRSIASTERSSQTRSSTLNLTADLLQRALAGTMARLPVEVSGKLERLQT